MVINLLGVPIYLKDMTFGSVPIIFGMVINLLGVPIYLKDMTFGAVPIIVGLVINLPGFALHDLRLVLEFRRPWRRATGPSTQETCEIRHLKCPRKVNNPLRNSSWDYPVLCCQDSLHTLLHSSLTNCQLGRMRGLDVLGKTVPSLNHKIHW